METFDRIEDLGDRTRDRVLPLTLHGNVVGVPGMVDGAVRLDGITGRLSHTLHHECLGLPDLCPHGITVGIWFRLDPEVMYNPGVTYTVIGSHSSTDSQGYDMEVTGNDAVIRVRLSSYELTCSFKMALEFWSHISFTWLEEDGLDLYQNGHHVCMNNTVTTTQVYSEETRYSVFSIGWSFIYPDIFTPITVDELVMHERKLKINEIIQLYGEDIFI